MQVVHLYQPDAGGVVYAADDGGVITGWKIGDNRRFARVRWSVAAILNILDLVVRDDAADDCLSPIVVGGNQSSVSAVQFQCRISQEIRNAMLAEFRANRTY